MLFIPNFSRINQTSLFFFSLYSAPPRRLRSGLSGRALIMRAYHRPNHLVLLTHLVVQVLLLLVVAAICWQRIAVAARVYSFIRLLQAVHMGQLVLKTVTIASVHVQVGQGLGRAP